MFPFAQTDFIDFLPVQKKQQCGSGEQCGVLKQLGTQMNLIFMTVLISMNHENHDHQRPIF